MRRPDQSHYNKKSQYSIPCTLDAPLAEEVIIDLHEIFLTKGIHSLKMPSITYGRKLIIDILNSIKYYQNVGYLTANASIKPYEEASFHNIYAILTEHGYLNKKESNFEHFFIDAFFFDFLIIEQDKQIVRLAWYNSYIELMRQFALESQMPIIIMCM